jgi:predicted  nucleic acid-binding Zn-ribbon protein
MTKLCLVCGTVFDGGTCPKCGEGSFEPVAPAVPVVAKSKQAPEVRKAGK